MRLSSPTINPLTIDVAPGADTERLPEANNDTPLFENARRDCCCLGKEYLDHDERNEQCAHKSQQCYDTPIAPLKRCQYLQGHEDGVVTHRIRLATPLKCQDKTDHSRYQDRSAQGIKLQQLFCHGELGCFAFGNLETEENDDGCSATERQVEIKAPPPRYIRSKGTTDQRSHDRGNSEEGAEEALDLGAILQRNSKDDAHNLGPPVSG